LLHLNNVFQNTNIRSHIIVDTPVTMFSGIQYHC